MNEKLDFEGTPLEIGDEVIYVTYWAQGMRRSTIKRFTKVKVDIGLGSLVMPEKLFKIPTRYDRVRKI